MREELVAHLCRRGVLLTWSLFLFLALISIINFLHITYYPVVHRVNIESVIHIVFISDQIDSALIILFAALSSFFTFLALQRINGNKWLSLSPLIIFNLSALLAMYGEYDLALVLVTVGVSFYIMLTNHVLKQTIGIIEDLLVILCIFEGGGLIHWILLPFTMHSGLTDIFATFSAIETQLFYAPADITPIVMLVLLFSYPLFAALNWLKESTAKSTRGEAALRQFSLRIDGRILLVIAILVTVFIASYSYLPSINPTGKYVGTDIYYYSQWIDEMEANPKQAIDFAVHDPSSRPLFLILLYYLQSLLHIPTIYFLEWIAIPIFCLLPVSIYCFGTVANGRAFAGLAALLSSFSINVVAGIYTAYYSNILALSLLYFSLALLLLAFRRTSYLYTALSCALSILTIFIHPWTWVFILVALLLFVGIRVVYIVIISHDEALAALVRLWPVIVFIAANIITDQLKIPLLAIPSGVEKSYDIASTSINLNELSRLGFNLYFTFRYFAGGFFNDLSAIVLAIIGTWWLTQHKGLSRDILLTWLSLGAIPTLFVDFRFNERIFYNLPIQLFSTVGLLFLSSSCINRKYLPQILIITYVLLNINYALRSVVSLV